MRTIEIYVEKPKEILFQILFQILFAEIKAPSNFNVFKKNSKKMFFEKQRKRSPNQAICIVHMH